MKQIDPRMVRVLDSQTKAIFINAILAIIISFGSVFYFWDFGLENFIAASLITFVLHKVMNAITLTYFQRKNYGNNFDEMMADATHASEVIQNFKPGEEGPEVYQVSMTIVETPEKFYGKYKDVDFYEWLKVKGSDGEPVKIVYFGTIDIDKGEIPKPQQIVLPPGLIYQVEAV